MYIILIIHACTFILRIPSSTNPREVRILLFGEMYIKRRWVHKNKNKIKSRLTQNRIPSVVIYGIPNDCCDFGLKCLKINYRTNSMI